ncbi:cystathionine beta-synthase [Gordonia soli NBRC 108243]|uniref:Cystathionine beta-synthase n=2 Tax=Gordonia soli TaxID=320799 RepID=M0QDT1_9ACTN|nr:cysteine synthase family protein [Gordonia soli]GAC66735.1 cystathionine beta-synthase [Gordonia soli NBRC 108243]
MGVDPSTAGGVYDSVLDAIGHTPLIRVNRLATGSAHVYLKLEDRNPGGGSKDRAAREMVLAAERSGDLRPGSTIVEGTSGNTGIGLALIGAVRDYRVVAVVPDKTSVEKIDLLRAYGAEVVITPGGRPVGHPEHVRTIAARLAAEIPGGWLAGQYDNPANPAAHHKTTGPEVWAQTGGAVTHFVAGIGTGGTVSGAGRFLHEVSGGAVRVVGADPVNSTYSGGDGRAFYVESVGHYRHPDTIDDELPASYHPEVLDEIVTISDREAIDTLRDLARLEGILVGGSGGVAAAAALRVAQRATAPAVVVALIPDSGRNYLSKYHQPEWRARWGFGADGIRTDRGSADDHPRVVGELVSDGYVGIPTSVRRGDIAAHARGLPELPVHLDRAGSDTVAAEIVGSVPTSITDGVVDDPIESTSVGALLRPPPPFAGYDEPLVGVATRLSGDEYTDRVVVVTRDGRAVGTVAVTELRAAAVPAAVGTAELAAAAPGVGADFLDHPNSFEHEVRTR